jgi:hypothetical protein
MHAAYIRASNLALRDEYAAATAADGLERVVVYGMVWDDGGVVSNNGRTVDAGLFTLLNLSERSIQCQSGKVCESVSLCFSVVSAFHSVLADVVCLLSESRDARDAHVDEAGTHCCRNGQSKRSLASVVPDPGHGRDAP